MVWTLDMDDFKGQFCRKNKRQALHQFPLLNAMKEEFELDEMTTPSNSLGMPSTTPLANETIPADDQLRHELDQLFLSASSSSNVSRRHRSLLHFLTTSYLIGAAISIVD